MWIRANQAFYIHVSCCTVIDKFAWCFVRMKFLFQKWLQWAFQNALADNIITLHKWNYSSFDGIESGWQKEAPKWLNWQQANRRSQLMNYFEFSRNHVKTRFSSKLVHGVFEDAFDAKLMTINDGKGFALFFALQNFQNILFLTNNNQGPQKTSAIATKRNYWKSFEFAKSVFLLESGNAILKASRR